MRYYLLIVLFLAPFYLWAEKNVAYTLNYADSLQVKADAIINYSHINYNLNASNELFVEVEKVITILSDRGDEFRDFVVGYDKLCQIKSLTCVILDQNNKVLRKLKKKDFNDFSQYDGFTLFSDNRLKHWSAVNPQYPYIIKVNYEMKYNGFIAIPRWIPQDDYRLAVHEAKLTFSFPPNLEIRYKSLRDSQILFSEKAEKDRKIYTWQITDLTARTPEQFSPSFEDQVPVVMIAPQKFEYEGYEGSSESWNSIGAWNYGLLPKESDLTDATMQQLDQLKKEARNKRELAKLVYEYAQSRTRYVGIQLGIGGWKPFPSITVDELGYGDCKALSFYIKTMLNYVGVESIYTVIGAGNLKISHLDFPSKNQTNHAILCIPVETDTLWLECTSQTDPFNHLSTGCTNRNALLIKKDGGEMVYIHQKNENVQSRKSHIRLLGDGAGEVEYHCAYLGNFFDQEKSLNELSDKELSQYLLKNLPVSDIKLSNFETRINSEQPELILETTFQANNLSTKAGDRIFVELSPFAQLSGFGKQKEKRRNQVVVENALEFNDQIIFEIPEGYVVELRPETKENNSQYGEYNFSINVEDKKVFVERNFKVRNGIYPKEAYDSFIDYLNQVSENDECKLVLKKE